MISTLWLGSSTCLSLDHRESVESSENYALTPSAQQTPYHAAASGRRRHSSSAATPASQVAASQSASRSTS